MGDVKRPIRLEERPVCSCGQPMKLEHHYEYYNGDQWDWYCDNDNCHISLILEELEPDATS